MFAKSPSEDAKGQKESVIDLLINALARLKLEPRLIPTGRIEWLKGGLCCIELEARKGVDSAILLSKRQIEMVYPPDAQTSFRVDYAVRGNIRGILPNRIITKTFLRTSGLIKKKIEELTWETPQADPGGDAFNQSFQREIDGLPPGLGEVWEGGPHQKLTELLNHDTGVIDSLIGIGEGTRGFPLSIAIVSDKGGESIRISGNLWLKSQQVLSIYVTSNYLEIANRIGNHIKEMRKEFGGLAF